MAREKRDSPFDDGPRWFKDEEELDQKEEIESQGVAAKARSQYGLERQSTKPETDAHKIDELLHQAEVLIEQLGHLYGMYFSGVEKRPPIEKRALLDKMMAQVTSAFKSTPSMRFKCQTLLGTYHTHRDLWDRKLRDLESGKITPIIRGASKPTSKIPPAPPKKPPTGSK